MTDGPGRYGLPHTAADERRRLQLLEARADPLTTRRIERLGLEPGARCLELGGGHGSIARWLCELVGESGHVTATDLETDFLDELALPNLEVLRHDMRTDDFPELSFDFIHVRAVLMHIGDRIGALRRMVSWLAPRGWLLVEEPDFGFWVGDFDPLWAAHPRTWNQAFPMGSLSEGRATLGYITRLGLEEVGADAELDIVQPGSSHAEFYRLSMSATARSAVAAGLLTVEEAAERVGRLDQPDFLSCGFAYFGAWGRRPAHV